jgi:2-polyprenyl-3-methyl-5-hydroxy-6-metoxy-1,4-benzoquinol methylase
MKDKSCSICGEIGKENYLICATEIKKKLSNHFNGTIPNNVEIDDYSIIKCDKCKFEFASPKKEGTSSFYNWITTQKDYYPQDRWEYHKVIELINPNSTLLDVGCGDGQFFDVIKTKGVKIDYLGIDPTQESINKCLNKDHKALCLTTSSFKTENPNVLFDYVVSFHCLEHIANPLLFLQEIKSLIKNTGNIFISTPYSPMTIELDWFDILNHPPHHMGRWNKQAYEAIAEKLNLNIEFFAPKSLSTIKAASSSFLLSETDNVMFNLQGKKIDLIKHVILNPFKFFTHLLKQSKREQLLNRKAPNVVLVKFSNK